MESPKKINATWFPSMVIVAMLIAAIALAVSIASHIASLLGIAILNDDQILGLLAVNIVVWMAVLLVARRMTHNGKRPGSFKMAFAGCPRWAGYVLKGFFAYAILICAYFLVTGIGHRAFADLTSAIRVFSSVWMLTYGTALAMLYSSIKTPPVHAAVAS